MTKEEYLSWRESNVTLAFQEEVQEDIDTLIASLATFAGDDPLKDKKTVGIIEGLKKLFEWVPTVESEDEDNTDAS